MAIEVKICGNKNEIALKLSIAALCGGRIGKLGEQIAVCEVALVYVIFDSDSEYDRFISESNAVCRTD